MDAKPCKMKQEFGHITSRGHEPESEAPTRRFLERLTNQDLINAVIPPRALPTAMKPNWTTIFQPSTGRLAFAITKLSPLH